MAQTDEIEVITFGCRLNTFESEVIRRHAGAAALKDAVIVHTCAVTAEAERQARQTIRRLRRERPSARIIVTGCSVQVSSGAYAAMAEVDHVVGNAEKLKPETWRELASATDTAPRIRVGDIMTVGETAHHLVDGLDGRTRAFLQVQQGCDHRCTFCIIPYGRGPSRSVPLPVIAEQARTLVAAGYREIVVTGVDITSYGKDLPGQPTLGAMLKGLLEEVPELSRLRLSSIDPAEIDDDLRDLVAEEPRLMPHLHLSVQAGDDLVLKRMKRRHLRRHVLEVTADLRRLRPDIVFGADLIAGFPTEDEAMFRNTLDLVDEAGLTFLHVFPYSARVGTPAARMPQVPKEVRKQRAARLREKGEAALDRFLRAQLGQRRRALMERHDTGHTDHFAPVRLAAGSPPLPAGTIAELTLEAVADGVLLGRPA
ncbi:tRNA (N(6)-L-threonylcarbamoyladenosine(37)-C(2))-methylthiotransferase MtaB [Benzoatithermus flavus]|uniref:tRNA (N(6)-L-threonylcarbamoyladenosine(37)-C(2))-methylthiotransferase MtaB n=1 Tax=Benzoatithermus flavus TaxID=3108223 RepID=A0ABU8XU98_9PROT